MTPLDAMKQALEALEETTALCINYESVEEDDGYKFTESKLVIPMGESAIANLRTTIAELESAKPVAWTTMPDAYDWEFVSGAKDPSGKLTGKWSPLFTHPAQSRDSIIEECAAVCEKYASDAKNARDKYISHHAGTMLQAYAYAAVAIRALKGK